MSTRSTAAMDAHGSSTPGRRGEPSGPPQASAPPLHRRKLAPRVPAFDYEGPYAYHLVLSTYGGLPLLGRAEVVETCLRRLSQSSEHHGFRVLAYCFMPSHLHLLILGSEKSHLLPFVKYFKQTSSFDCRGETRQLWRRSFYDRVLRAEEDLDGVARYI